MSSSSIPQIPFGVSALGQPLDFSKIKDNAIQNGYEPVILQAMLERSAMQAISSHPGLHSLPPAEVQREVGQQFLSRIERCGGFRQAYQEERLTLGQFSQIRRSMPEKRLEGFALSASAFIEHAGKASMAHFHVKEKLIEEARTAASALAKLGSNELSEKIEQVVCDHLSQYPVLIKEGLAGRAQERMAQDRQAAAKARPKVQAKAKSILPGMR